MRYVKIPRDRVAVLIGPEGKTKERIERRLGVRLLIDSDMGDVEIDDRQAKDALAQLKAENVVRAIGRGFSPQVAFRLFSDDEFLSILDIHDFVGKDKSHVRRVTARIVGTDGKTRRHVEEMTGARLSIYGHTVGVLGPLESHQVATEAVSMLLSGSEHAAVYRFLEAKRRDARMAEFGF